MLPSLVLLSFTLNRGVGRLLDNFGHQMVEEHDSITSLIAAVESGRGVAVIAQLPNGLASS